MNWLLICVLGILVACALEGCYKGFVRSVFSLLAMVVTLVFVTVVTPHLTAYLEENTSWDEAIAEKCLEHVRQTSEERVNERIEEQVQQQEETAEGSGIFLPEQWLDRLADSGSNVVNDIIEQSGVQETIARELAHFIMTGLSFFIALVFISLVLHLIIRALDIVTRLPVIKHVNRTLGIVAGLFKGLLVVWVLMYLISLMCTSEFGMALTDYIYRSHLLTLLYEHNVLMRVVMAVF